MFCRSKNLGTVTLKIYLKWFLSPVLGISAKLRVVTYERREVKGSNLKPETNKNLKTRKKFQSNLILKLENLQKNAKGVA